MPIWKRSIDGNNIEKVGRVATSFEVQERQGNIIDYKKM